MESIKECVEARTNLSMKKGDAIFLKGVIDFLVYKLITVAVASKTFLALADLKSAIEEHHQFNKVKKVVSTTFLLVCFFRSK